MHRIAFNDGVLYNSHNGLVGKAYSGEDVQRGVPLMDGCTFGVKSAGGRERGNECRRGEDRCCRAFKF